MDSWFGAFRALVHELDTAAILDRPVAHIRVTLDAIPGTPALMPLTPERARQIRLIAVREPDGPDTVEADPHVWLRTVELLMHPRDWREVKAMLPRDTAEERERAGVPAERVTLRGEGGVIVDRTRGHVWRRLAGRRRKAWKDAYRRLAHGRSSGEVKLGGRPLPRDALFTVPKKRGRR